MELPRITVQQCHEMIRLGLIPEGAQIELVDGMLVYKDRSKRGADPMSVSPEHAWTVETMWRLNERVQNWGMHVASQQPVTLTTTDEPEPDVSFVLGPLDDYRHRLPTASDVMCVCEVADSSLDYDRTTKQRLYATSGIPLYFIVNLVDRVVELYSGPDAATGRYARRRDVARGESFQIELGPGRALTVSADELLP